MREKIEVLSRLGLLVTLNCGSDVHRQAEMKSNELHQNFKGNFIRIYTSRDRE